MEAAERSWVAGYLEGEGCFHLVKRSHERFGDYYYARVVCACTDLDVLQHLQRCTGAGRIIGPTQRGTDKPIWRWTVSKAGEAAALMEAIYPNLGQRRQAKVDEILEFAGRDAALRFRSRTLDQRAWVAGYLEAEGGFYCTKIQKGKYGPYYYPRVGVGSTDADVVRLLPEYTGVGQVTGPYARKPPFKAVWHWKVSNVGDAVALMESIYPYMGERRRAQIDDVLSFVERKHQHRLAQRDVIRLEESKQAQLHTTTKGRV